MTRQRNLRMLLLPFVCLLLLLLAIPLYQLRNPIDLIVFRDRGSGMQFRPFYEWKSQTYSLILPSFVEEENIEISIPWYLKGENFTEHIGEQYAKEYTLSSILGTRRSYRIQMLSCSIDRSLFITTEANTLDYLNEDKNHKRTVETAVYNREGQMEQQGRAVMYGRGNCTWEAEKKPYNLEFSEEVSFGTIEPCKKIALMAEERDDSKLRNAVSYYIGKQLEIPYASGYEFVDLFVNGSYQGLYAMTTKEMYRKDASVDTVFEFTTSTKGERFETEYGSRIRVLSGSVKDVKSRLSVFETALREKDWETVASYIDVTSWAGKYALDEFLYDSDLGIASQYFYVNQDGKIACMLPWDYELTFYGWFYPNKINPREGLAVYFWEDGWFQRLLDWKVFREASAAFLEQKMTPELFQNVQQYAERAKVEIQSSMVCDGLLWKEANISGIEAEQFTKSLREYCPERSAFLQKYLKHPKQYCRISFYGEEDGQQKFLHTVRVIPKGESLEDLEENIRNHRYYLDWENVAFYQLDGTPFLFTGTVEDNLDIFVAKVR